MRRVNLLALIICALATVLSATSVVPMSVEQMAVNAPLIVRVKAVSSEARWNSAHTLISTYTNFEVLETLKGKAPATLLVRQMGGTADGITQKVSGLRSFTAGEESVLFLRPSDEQGAMAIVGLFQGNFSVKRSTATAAIVSNGVPEAEQYDPSTGSTTHFRSSNLTLNELKQRVVRVVGQ